MGERLTGPIFRAMVVLVMWVMGVRLRVFHGFVNVLMFVMLGDV